MDEVESRTAAEPANEARKGPSQVQVKARRREDQRGDRGRVSRATVETSRNTKSRTEWPLQRETEMKRENKILGHNEYYSGCISRIYVSRTSSLPPLRERLDASPSRFLAMHSHSHPGFNRFLDRLLVPLAARPWIESSAPLIIAHSEDYIVGQVSTSHDGCLLRMICDLPRGQQSADLTGPTPVSMQNRLNRLNTGHWTLHTGQKSGRISMATGARNVNTPAAP